MATLVAMPATIPTSDEFNAGLASVAAQITAVQATCNKILAALGPTPPPAIQPPPQAVAAGYTKLAFDDEFTAPPDIGYGTTGHKWNAGLWYNPVPAASCFTQSGSNLTITSPPGSSDIDLTTEYHDTSGGTFWTNGYFEASMACSNWSAAWLFSQAHTQNKAGLCSEIDIIETDSGNPTTIYQTLHSNTGGGGGVADQYNQGKGSNVWNPTVTGGQVLGQFHTFGVLWTPTAVTFYYDNKPAVTMPPYANSTQQPMFLILSAQPGGILKSPAVQPVTTVVDFVRVWTS